MAVDLLTKIGRQSLAGNNDAFVEMFGFQELHGNLAADLGDAALEVADAGLPGVVADNGDDGVIRELDIGILQAVFLNLTGNKEILGDVIFLCLEVAV